MRLRHTDVSHKLLLHFTPCLAPSRHCSCLQHPSPQWSPSARNPPNEWQRSPRPYPPHLRPVGLAASHCGTANAGRLVSSEPHDVRRVKII
jgi:hypothetical protein